MPTARLAAEVLLLRQRFPDLMLGGTPGQGTDWICTNAFELPPGWNVRHAGLLIPIPPGYPEMPPLTFFLQQGLRDQANRGVDRYYHEQESSANPYARHGWAWYCYHITPGAWRPTSSPTTGDSLLTYITVIYQALAGQPVR